MLGAIGSTPIVRLERFAEPRSALELARRLGPGKRDATTLAGPGLTYLGGDLYAAA